MRRPPDHAAVRGLLGVMRQSRTPGWVRDALDPDLCATALAERVGDLVPGARAVRRVVVDDARARRRHWALRYGADVATDHGDERVQLVAELHPPGVAPPASDAGTVVLPGLGLAVRAVSDDPGLEALPGLSDPATARALLERALRGPERGDLRLVAVHPRLARHKAGNRATLVYRLDYPAGADPDWPRIVVAKTYRGNEGAVTYVAMRALWQQRKVGTDAPRLAEPLAYMPESRVLLQGPVPGDRQLSDLVRSTAATTDAGRSGAQTRAGPTPDSTLSAALHRTARGLASLHGFGVRAGPARDVSSELAAVRRVLSRVAMSLPVDSVRAADMLLGELASRAGRQPASVPGPVHGAFRPAQVLLHDGHVGFVDFDGFGTGEPALDVGRFLARLDELWLTATARPDARSMLRRRELSAVFVSAYREQARLAGARVQAWRCLDLAGGVVRSWARAQPARAAMLIDLLDASLADAD